MTRRPFQANLEISVFLGPYHNWIISFLQSNYQVPRRWFLAHSIEPKNKIKWLLKTAIFMWPALQAATVLLARGTKKNLGELLCGGRFRKRLQKTFRKQARFITRKRKNPKGNTLYTKNPNEDPQKCDPPKLKTHTHENRTRNNTDVKVSERACRSRACGSARHTSSVLSSLFPNLFSHNSLALVLEGHRFSCSLHEEIGCRGEQFISFFLSQLMTWC